MHKDPWNLQAMLEPVVTTMGYELVGLEYHGRGHHGLLRIYIDSPDGITVDDCSAVSHQVSGVLDVEDPIPGRYSLEVSSPGLDRPLFTAEHFERFAGEYVRLRLLAPLNGRRKYEGLLKGMKGDNVILELDQGDELCLPFQDIENARLEPRL